MGMEKTVGKAALELAQNENIVNKTTDFLGMLFPFVGLKKKALDMYLSDIEKSDLPSESKLMATLNAKQTIKKLKNQSKIADIAVANAPEGTDFSEQSGVNEEWFDRFMDSAGFVSAEDVQLIWGKILAKEFENPGSTPSNMIRILSEITPTYAQAFRKICSMKTIIIGIDDAGNPQNAAQRVIVPYSQNEETLNNMGLTFSILNELDTFGLIKFNSLSGYAAIGFEQKIVLLYANGKTIAINEHEENRVPIGNVMLTSTGECLMNITPTEIISDYDKMLIKYLQDGSTRILEDSEYEVLKLSEDQFRVLKTHIDIQVKEFSENTE
ncbi:MAG: DUF2806 domain-containing protein [Lachnospiraceae bacterium]|nr:DUF2806 domain-containing protein [Lachnospiraceae bacterium]